MDERINGSMLVKWLQSLFQIVIPGNTKPVFEIPMMDCVMNSFVFGTTM